MPMYVVQLDNNSVNLFLKDSEYQESIGTANLCAGIDVYTTMITGFEYTLNPLNRQSILETLVQSIMPKDRYVANLFKDDQYSPTWEIEGFPVLILVDNGMDYRSEDVKRFCKEYDIILEFAPVKKPKYKFYNKWQGSIRRGHWKEFCIHNWNDFLMKCFGEINTKVNHYIGKQGLLNAKEDILAYEEHYNEKPISSTREIYGIIGAIYRGEWTEEGIDGFQDILDYVYGKFDPKKEFETWKEKARKFYTENGHPPRKRKDEEFKKLKLDLNQGRFLPIGLSNWTSFIERALNIDFKTYKRSIFEINRKSKKRSKNWKPHGYYRGRSGFENAIQVLRSKYLENGKFPHSSSKGLSGLYNAVRRGYYTEFGVSSWNEMKEFCLNLWIKQK